MQRAAPEGFEPIDSPFLQLIGPVYGRVTDGMGEIWAPLQERHLNASRIARGGFLMSLIDILFGRSVKISIGGRASVTLSLNCDFVSAAKPDTVVTGTARVRQVSREIVAVRGGLEADGRPVATASGLWKILAARPDAPPPPERIVVPIPADATPMPAEDPFERLVGPVLRTDDGRYALSVSAHHANVRGGCHGGMLMTFVDAVLGDAVWIATDKAPCVTLSQATDFLDAVPLGALLECRPEIVARTPSTLLTQGHFQVAGRTAMTARTLWKLIGTD